MSDSDTDEYTYEEMHNEIEANSLSMATKRKLDDICRNGQQSSSDDRNDHSDSDSDQSDDNDESEQNAVKIDYVIDKYIKLLLCKFKNFNVNESKYSHVIEKCERLFKSFKRQKPQFLQSHTFLSLICGVSDKIAGEVDLTDIIKHHHNAFIKIMIRVLRDEPISSGNHTQTENRNASNQTFNHNINNNAINNNVNAIAIINDNNINNNNIVESDLNNVRKRLKFDYMGSRDETASMRNGSINGSDIRSSVSSTASEDITVEDITKSAIVLNGSSPQMFEKRMTNGVKKSINMAVVSPVPVNQSLTSSSMALVSPASSTISVMSPVSDTPLSNDIVSPSSASMTSVISGDSLKRKSLSHEYTIYPALNKRIDSEIKAFLNPKSHWYKEGTPRLLTLPIFYIIGFISEVNEENNLGLTEEQQRVLHDPVFRVIKHQVTKQRKRRETKRNSSIINID